MRLLLKKDVIHLKTVSSVTLMEQKKKKTSRKENRYGEVGCNFNMIVRGGLIEKVIFKQWLELESTHGGKSSIPFMMVKLVICVSYVHKWHSKL